MHPFRHPMAAWLFALALCAGFAGLGAWQLDRRAQKLRMIAAVDTVLRERHAQPLSAAASSPAEGDVSAAYAWAGGQGRFADAPPVLLDNQQRDGRVGVRAYRLFLPVQGEPLLVELGWLPLPSDRRMPDVPRPLPGRARLLPAGRHQPRRAGGLPADDTSSGGLVVKAGASGVFWGISRLAISSASAKLRAPFWRMASTRSMNSGWAPVSSPRRPQYGLSSMSQMICSTSGLTLPVSSLTGAPLPSSSHRS